MALAVAWEAAEKISPADRNEIIAIVERARPNDWRPLIFLIPYPPVAARVQVVPREKRASHEFEYIVPDLRRSEFEIIEP
jgi:hypothetical protein